MVNAVAPSAGPIPSQRNDPELERVAREFEGIVLAELLAPIFETMDADGLGGGGMGEKMFRPMLVQHYAEAIARSGGVGFAQSILTEFTRMQAAAPEDENGADR